METVQLRQHPPLSATSRCRLFGVSVHLADDEDNNCNKSITDNTPTPNTSSSCFSSQLKLNVSFSSNDEKYDRKDRVSNAPLMTSSNVKVSDRLKMNPTSICPAKSRRPAHKK